MHSKCGQEAHEETVYLQSLLKLCSKALECCPADSERMQLLNSLSQTAEISPGLGQVLNWCIDCCPLCLFVCLSACLSVYLCLSVSLCVSLSVPSVSFRLSFFAVSFWYHDYTVSLTCTWILSAVQVYDHHHHQLCFALRWLSVVRDLALISQINGNICI